MVQMQLLFDHKPSQEEVVLKHLQTIGRLTMGQGEDLYNIHRLSERIRRLRLKGYVIDNVQVKEKSIQAIYELRYKNVYGSKSN